ncbi:hypothetical protein F4861DRAFT_231155 [Xylaria intraflava]|nr:hypothetical protein F4861DRAFT_231155 [Xylaria intraflava]
MAWGIHGHQLGFKASRRYHRDGERYYSNRNTNTVSFEGEGRGWAAHEIPGDLVSGASTWSQPVFDAGRFQHRARLMPYGFRSGTSGSGYSFGPQDLPTASRLDMAYPLRSHATPYPATHYAADRAVQFQPSCYGSSDPWARPSVPADRRGNIDVEESGHVRGRTGGNKPSSGHRKEKRVEQRRGHSRSPHDHNRHHHHDDHRHRSKNHEDSNRRRHADPAHDHRNYKEKVSQWLQDSKEEDEQQQPRTR